MERLWREIRDQYDNVEKHVFLYGYKRSKRRVIGEIDLVGVKEGSIDLYEVKCSHRVVKAKKQLRKAKKVLQSTTGISAEQAIKAYFYNGESKELQLVLI